MSNAANDQLHLSHDGIALVQEFEGCLKRMPDGRFKAYTCPAGVLTIGWGTTNEHGHHFTPDTVWTRTQCDAAFVEDMVAFENDVKKLVTTPLTQGEFDALTSFSYNCGSGALAKSTLLRKVNAGDMADAAQEFKKWNKGGGRVLAGLTRRRASESLMFQGIKDADHDGKADPVED